jgi:NAD dependent epimerase/dehydratase
MSKVFITGGCGFIGSHLCEFLLEENYDVVVFDRYNTNNDWGWLETSKYKNDINVILGDIRDYDSVYKSMKGCDVVYHLAALIGIPYSYLSPLAYIKTNVEGTYNVLESAKNLDISQILVTSTSETYGSAQYIPIDEKHPLVGQSPYSASKIGSDHLAISYYKSFELPVKIVRPFNTYGPRQSARAIIPTIVSQIHSGITNIKLGNLAPTRDLTYVLDTCAGFYEIFRSNCPYGEPINIGMNEEISIGDLVQLISKIMGIEVSVFQDNSRKRPSSSEVDRLICDNSKILSGTNWKPKFTLDEGLKEFIDWLNIPGISESYKPGKYNV